MDKPTGVGQEKWVGMKKAARMHIGEFKEKEIAEECGVSDRTIRSWRKDEHWAAAVAAAGEKMADDLAVKALRNMKTALEKEAKHPKSTLPVSRWLLERLNTKYRPPAKADAEESLPYIVERPPVGIQENPDEDDKLPRPPEEMIPSKT